VQAIERALMACQEAKETPRRLRVPRKKNEAVAEESETVVQKIMGFKSHR
jgi:hypothetical protein